MMQQDHLLNSVIDDHDNKNRNSPHQIKEHDHVKNY